MRRLRLLLTMWALLASSGAVARAGAPLAGEERVAAAVTERLMLATALSGGVAVRLDLAGGADLLARRPGALAGFPERPGTQRPLSPALLAELTTLLRAPDG